MPSGLLADRFGGPRVLLAGLALWSLATAALPLARGSPAPLAVLTLARVLFGLGSAVALPCVSATVSRLVPPARRASQLAIVYACFNIGSIVGMATTPPLIAAAGWHAVFLLYGVLGVAWAAFATVMLPPTVRAGRRAELRSAAPAPPRAAAGGGLTLRPGGAVQLASLVWIHSVIGCGFFILLSWIPTYLSVGHGLTDLRAVGLISALPWLVCAAVGIGAGSLADWLGAARRWPTFRVRTVMNRIASLGPALSLAALPLTSSPAVAVLCLCTAMGAHSFNFAGASRRWERMPD